VILVDVNLLLYSINAASSQHVATREWLDRQLIGSVPVGLPWVTLLGFLRLATNSRVVASPLMMPAAWQQVAAWLACEPAWIPQPTERHAGVLADLLALPGVHGNLVTDAHLAALAIEHGLTLFSSDGDLPAFRGCTGAIRSRRERMMLMILSKKWDLSGSLA
jgi:toxin-antitoxin system PIN domain toxin